MSDMMHKHPQTGMLDTPLSCRRAENDENVRAESKMTVRQELEHAGRAAATALTILGLSNSYPSPACAVDTLMQQEWQNTVFRSVCLAQASKCFVDLFVGLCNNA